jgi:hypothetical protein
LYPYLFYLVIDAFCQILIRGRNESLIQGLGLVLDNGHRIINFHYTDDTIFFLQTDYKCVETVMWALASGLNRPVPADQTVPKLMPDPSPTTVRSNGNLVLLSPKIDTMWTCPVRTHGPDQTVDRAEP